MKRFLQISGRMLILLGITLFGTGQIAWADEATENAIKSAGYIYEIEYPENQKGDSAALNLRMAAGQKQTVNFSIKNTTDEAMTIELKLNGARTNGNGGLEYGPNKFKAANSMQYDLPDLVKVANEVNVPANSEITVPLEISMPEVEYEGIVTGGLQMTKKEKDDNEQASAGQVVVNKVAYLFGITLSETDKEVPSKLELEKVYAGLSNYRNAIFLDIANSKSKKMEKMTLDAEVTKKGQKEVLYETKKTNMAMAPHSLMQYPVSMDGERMQAGKYTAHIVVGDGKDEWEWTQDFEITDEEADKFNQQDVSLVQERGINWKIIAGIIAAVLGLVVIILVLVRVLGGNKKKRKSSKK